jgi:phosphomannomutase
MGVPDLRAAARAWLADDPDPVTRGEVEALLAVGDDAALAARFGARLEFGTAGLRGALGAGPNRMNRVMVRRTAAGVARHLLDAVPGAADAGVVVGRDARHRSDDFLRDVVAVLTGAGIRVHAWDHALPTPLTAWAVRRLDAAAGVMVTASHNPPQDNGIKVYAGDGAQIVPPTDAAISAAIDAVGRVTELPEGDVDGPLVHVLGDTDVETYLGDVVALAPRPDARDVRIASTAMHGVGGPVLVRLLARAGFPPVAVVGAQQDPDPDFSTVPFPNPEEPGALDLLLDLAREIDAHIAVANDPDADRLAVCAPGPNGWRALTGDEVGALLADHLLTEGAGGPERLVATTIVSSTLLARIAAEHGVHHATTLTGFKWIVRPGLLRPDLQPVLGYEEALGYAVGSLVRDKDGLSAALVAAELAAVERIRGRTLIDRLDDLARRHGLHATAGWPVRFDGPDGPARIAAGMAALRGAAVGELGGRAVRRVLDLSSDDPEAAALVQPSDHPPGDVIVLELDGGRAVVRPSGTEPKLKAYLEVVLPVATGADVEAVRADARVALEAVRADLASVLGL